MKIARPRLLGGSLAIAVLAITLMVIAAFVWAEQNDDGGALDAVLGDPQGVVTFPNDGLTNGDVAGTPFPDAVFLDGDDNEVTSAELIGEPLVVNLWFSSCAPCAKELPAFAAVDAEVDDVRFIGVNTVDSVEEMERFAGERGVTYELLRDQFAELTDGIGAVAFPITLFVTSDGTIIEQTGPLDADELRDKVAKLRTVEESL